MCFSYYYIGGKMIEPEILIIGDIKSIEFK